MEESRVVKKDCLGKPDREPDFSFKIENDICEYWAEEGVIRISVADSISNKTRYVSTICYESTYVHSKYFLATHSHHFPLVSKEHKLFVNAYENYLAEKELLHD